MLSQDHEKTIRANSAIKRKYLYIKISVFDHFDIMLVTVIFFINSLEKFQVIILKGYVD